MNMIGNRPSCEHIEPRGNLRDQADWEFSRVVAAFGVAACVQSGAPQRSRILITPLRCCRRDVGTSPLPALILQWMDRSCL